MREHNFLMEQRTTREMVGTVGTDTTNHMRITMKRKLQR